MQSIRQLKKSYSKLRVRKEREKRIVCVDPVACLGRVYNAAENVAKR